MCKGVSGVYEGVQWGAYGVVEEVQRGHTGCVRRLKGVIWGV